MIKPETKALNQDITALIPEIISATFSKNVKTCEYKKIRIDKKDEFSFKIEKFTETQAFQSLLNIEQIKPFLLENISKNFKNTAIRLSDGSTVYYMANKKGVLHKTTAKPKDQKSTPNIQKPMQNNRIKSYIIPEGIPVPFLIELGVMNTEGKVLAKNYDKFRQINRFLEFIKDILPELKGKQICGQKTISQQNELSIIDFGCGKSYLTFAVYHYLKTICGINCNITGVDLKADVIKECSNLAKKCNYSGLQFFCGDIADWKTSEKSKVDLVMTLHACDTATDYALNFAVKNNARVILSVPCCQHELNSFLSIKENQKKAAPEFSSLLKHGIIRDKFLSLATDILRSDLLEQYGYKVQVLEFIDMEHTPKNVLIRAVKREICTVRETKKGSASAASDFENLKQALGASITLERLLSS